METNTYLTKHDVLNETSLWRGLASTWSPRVMISDEMSYGKILRIKISQNGNGFPIRSMQCFVSRGHRHAHLIDFSFFNHRQNLDFKTMAWKYLISILFHPPPKNLRMSLRALNERCRSWWVSTALLGTVAPCTWQPAQNTVIIWSGSFPVSSYWIRHESHHKLIA